MNFAEHIAFPVPDFFPAVTIEGYSPCMWQVGHFGERSLGGTLKKVLMEVGTSCSSAG